MKRFAIRSLIYILPLIILIIIIFVVDPYYLFSYNKSFDQDKFDIGYSYDQGRRYKIFTYWNNPTDNIILGASEINIINERNIPEDGWHSLSYGGAALQESLGMYWEAKKIHPLKKVIIAPEFIKYFNAISTSKEDPYYANFSWDSSQSLKALEIYNNKLDYFIDKYTLLSTWQYILTKMKFGTDRSKPQMSKSEFWKSQMDYAHQQYGGNVVLPEKKDEVLSLFREIKTDAEDNGTAIILVIPIQHVELLRAEFQNGIFDIYVDYILNLTEIFGSVYYLAYYKDISEDEESFSDPFHCTKAECYLNSLFLHPIKPLLQEDVKDSLNIIRDRILNTMAE